MHSLAPMPCFQLVLAVQRAAVWGGYLGPGPHAHQPHSGLALQASANLMALQGARVADSDPGHPVMVVMSDNTPFSFSRLALHLGYCS